MKLTRKGHLGKFSLQFDTISKRRASFCSSSRGLSTPSCDPRLCIVQVPDALNAVSFGAAVSAGDNGLGSALASFHGQMGAIYLFDDLLAPGGGATSAHLKRALH
jgi:hypothetical protein